MRAMLTPVMITTVHTPSANEMSLASLDEDRQQPQVDFTVLDEREYSQHVDKPRLANFFIDESDVNTDDEIIVSESSL